jgi:hypothetical protein
MTVFDEPDQTSKLGKGRKRKSKDKAFVLVKEFAKKLPLISDFIGFIIRYEWFGIEI